MAKIFFVFTGEGSSDAALVPHLESLCIQCGAKEAAGIAPDLGRLTGKTPRAVEQRLEAVLSLEPNANLVFVHRDADARDPEPRLREIKDAVEGLRDKASIPGTVAVVPVQELEAWLLVDEEEIRRVAGNPKGTMSLELPSTSGVEKISDAKACLNKALLTASGLSGRRRAKFKASLPKRCRLLLGSLSVDGRVRQLPAWEALRSRLTRAIESLNDPVGKT